MADIFGLPIHISISLPWGINLNHCVVIFSIGHSYSLLQLGGNNWLREHSRREGHHYQSKVWAKWKFQPSRIYQLERTSLLSITMERTVGIVVLALLAAVIGELFWLFHRWDICQRAVGQEAGLWGLKIIHCFRLAEWNMVSYFKLMPEYAINNNNKNFVLWWEQGLGLTIEDPVPIW